MKPTIRSCFEKRRYPNEAAARHAAQESTVLYGKTHYIYACSDEDDAHYHMTTSKRGKR